MPDYAIANETIFPTANDVAQTSGEGIKLLELTLATWRLGTERSWVLSGFVVPDSSANFDLSVPSGLAYISGYRVNIPNSTTVTCAASTTNYLWLKLTRDGSNKVNAALFERNTGTPPSDSVLIAIAITSGSAITDTIDCRASIPLTMSPYFGISGTGASSSLGMNSYTLISSNTTLAGVQPYEAFRLKSGVTITGNQPILMIISQTVIDIGGTINMSGQGANGGPAGVGAAARGGPGTDQQGGGGGGDGSAQEGGAGGTVMLGGIPLESGTQSLTAGAAGIQVTGHRMNRSYSLLTSLSGGSGGGGGAPGTGGSGGRGGGTLVLCAPIVRLRSTGVLSTGGSSGNNASSGNSGGGGGGGAGNVYILCREGLYDDQGVTFSLTGGPGGANFGAGGIGGAGANGQRQIWLFY